MCSHLDNLIVVYIWNIGYISRQFCFLLYITGLLYLWYNQALHISLHNNLEDTVIQASMFHVPLCIENGSNKCLFYHKPSRISSISSVLSLYCSTSSSATKESTIITYYYDIWQFIIQYCMFFKVYCYIDLYLI